MEIKNGNILLSKNKLENIKTLNGVDYEFNRLNPDFEGNKGGNSMLFTLKSEEEEDKVIKISRSILGSKIDFHQTKIKRFEREIEALLKSQGKHFIINYFFDGDFELDGKNYRYYVMEKADLDLKDFIINNQPDFQNRILICRQILDAFTELKSLDIYHRDIKPDNFFYVNDVMKVGDLGLIQYRSEDKSLDKENELIGPRGWLSPEAMNKFLTFNKPLDFNHDCDMDFQSDIFQLGKLFWFIFQYNVPIGIIKRSDFLIKDDQIYSTLAWMLNHSKKRRPHLEQLVKCMSPIFLRYAA
jgi:serine/threonine protein kinase